MPGRFASSENRAEFKSNKPLDYATKYRVVIGAEWDGQSAELEYCFTTAKLEPKVVYLKACGSTTQKVCNFV